MSKNQIIDWSTRKTFKSSKRGKDKRFTIFVYDNKHRKYPLMLQNVKLVKIYELKEPKTRHKQQDR